MSDVPSTPNLGTATCTQTKVVPFEPDYNYLIDGHVVEDLPVDLVKLPNCVSRTIESLMVRSYKDGAGCAEILWDYYHLIGYAQLRESGDSDDSPLCQPILGAGAADPHGSN